MEHVFTIGIESSLAGCSQSETLRLGRRHSVRERTGWIVPEVDETRLPPHHAPVAGERTRIVNGIRRDALRLGDALTARRKRNALTAPLNRSRDDVLLTLVMRSDIEMYVDAVRAARWLIGLATQGGRVLDRCGAERVAHHLQRLIVRQVRMR